MITDKFKKLITKKNGIIAAIVFGAIALPVLLLQIQKSQDSRSGASAGSVTYSFDALKKPATNQEFTFDVVIDTGGLTVEALDFSISYAGDKITFVDFTPVTAVAGIPGIPPPADSGTTKFYRFAGYTSKSQALSGTAQKIGTIKFKANPQFTSGTIDFRYTAGKAGNSVNAIIPTITAALLKYTIGDTGAVNFFFEPATSTITSQQTFTVTVRTNSGTTPVEAVDYTITYPATKLEIVKFENASKVSPIPQDTQPAGQYRFIGTTSSASPITGASDTLATITFKAKELGTATVSFTNAKAGNTQNPTLTTSFSATGNYTISNTVASVTPQATPIPTVTSIPAPTTIILPTGGIPSNETAIRLALSLPGIGKGSGYNAGPKRSQRGVWVTILNASNTAVLSDKLGTLEYNHTTGKFEGLVGLGSTVPTGNYIVKVKVDNSLVKRIPGIVTITSGSQANGTYQATLVTGDLNGDNTLSIDDYNGVVACYKSGPGCTTSILVLSDLDDNGTTKGDTDDYQILQRGFAVRDGD